MPSHKKETRSIRSHLIEERVLHAVLSREISPGERLGEKELGDIFGVSRTLVREAMMRLSSRGIVAVSPRRGWFVIEPSVEEACETIEARRAIEVGILLAQRAIKPEIVTLLEAHVDKQQKAIDEQNLARRSYLLGHFHVYLAEVLGNSVLAGILEELTTRLVLTAALYQSDSDAQRSCDNHRRLTAAISAQKLDDAVSIMNAHLTHLHSALRVHDKPSRLTRLQQALSHKTCP